MYTLLTDVSQLQVIKYMNVCQLHNVIRSVNNSTWLSSFWVVGALATSKHLKFKALKSTKDPKFCDMVKAGLDDSGPYL